jgi:pimeloyl-ACP methyl ester carboxylesterase
VVPADLHVATHHPDASGPRVIIVHGAPDRSKNFAAVVRLLADLPVTTYDRRGYGRSLSAHPPSNGFDRQADDLLSILDGQPAVVCGQSAGGSIAMLAATRAPDLFLSIGVWEPPMRWADWWPDTSGLNWMPDWLELDSAWLGESFNRQLIGEDRWEALPERTRHMLRAEGAAFRADLLSQERPPYDVADLRSPMVVGAGTVGPDWMVEGCRRLAERTGGEFLLVEGATHVAHTHHPEVWAQVVRRAVALADG